MKMAPYWLAVLAVLPLSVAAAPFSVPEFGQLPGSKSWSNKVELADLNGDGATDIVFANGRGYASAGGGERNTVLFNPNGAEQPWADQSNLIFGKQLDQSRAIKVRDFDQDGNLDIFVANTFQTQSRYYRGVGPGLYFDETASRLPQSLHSFGDAEAGDVDGDGDLDLVLADWGPGNPLNNGGASTRLWLNDGAGNFTDVTANQMPNTAVGFSWEMELHDVDNDWDLDALVSCKSCAGSVLLINDGAGVFTNASDLLPAFSNNYDFDALDITGDGYLDLATINDGPGLTEHLLVGDGSGGFVDATESLWPSPLNIGEDDNVARFVDLTGDGISDLFIGSLSGADRWLTLNAQGEVEALNEVSPGPNTPGTLDVAFTDFNGDGKLDLVQAQGEVGDETNWLYYGEEVPVDGFPPIVSHIEPVFDGENLTEIRVKAHDGLSGTRSTNQVQLTVETADSDVIDEVNVFWSGGYIYRISNFPAGVSPSAVCGVDPNGNKACFAVTQTTPPDEREEAEEQVSDAGQEEFDGEAAEGETDGGTGRDGNTSEGPDSLVDSDSESQGSMEESPEVASESLDVDTVETIENTEEEDEVDSATTDIAPTLEIIDSDSPLQQSGGTRSGGCSTGFPRPQGLDWFLALICAFYSFSRRSRTSPSCSRKATRSSIPSDSTF